LPEPLFEDNFFETLVLAGFAFFFWASVFLVLASKVEHCLGD
jgi:hypothetical protein